MRTVHRSSPEYVTGVFTETTGKDITECDVQVGLSSSDTVPPTSWQNPDVDERPTPATARVSLLVDAGVPAGTYALWVKVTDSPETLVRCARNELVMVV